MGRAKKSWAAIDRKLEVGGLPGFRLIEKAHLDMEIADIFAGVSNSRLLRSNEEDK